jgi:hypothetical protein
MKFYIIAITFAFSIREVIDVCSSLIKLSPFIWLHRASNDFDLSIFNLETDPVKQIFTISANATLSCVRLNSFAHAKLNFFSSSFSPFI